MNNKDLPAYPVDAQTFYYAQHERESCNRRNSLGITKREMFAKDAPACPVWFRQKFKHDNRNDESLVIRVNGASAPFGCDDKELLSFEMTSKGEMKLIREWRYAYADMMLGDE